MAELDKDGKTIKRSTGPYGWNTIVKQGSRYMTRLWLGRVRIHIFYRGDDDRDPHDHPWPFWTLPATSYVEEVYERIEGTDQFAMRLQVVPAWRLNYRPAEHMHRVIGPWHGRVRLADGFIFDHPISYKRFMECNTDGRYEPVAEEFNGNKLVTLVIRGGFSRMWGFLRNRDGRWCWQNFKEYLNNNGGGDAPCA